VNPTHDIYCDGLSKAYDYFNRQLFDGTLPPCLLTLQRKNRTYGYFSPERMKSRDGAQVADEIALNPAHFLNRSTEEILSTLVHEMAHLWQHHHGTPSRSGYHNKEWAKKMQALGLIPTDTGKEGGKMTGQHMTHYIATDGAFARSCAELVAAGFDFALGDVVTEPTQLKKPTKSGVRAKYTCSGCGLNAWARPDALLVCGECTLTMTMNE